MLDNTPIIVPKAAIAEIIADILISVGVDPDVADLRATARVNGLAAFCAIDQAA